MQINYRKSIDLLDAQDRINLFYNPTTGQLGKDLSQLMDGVDYGGVQVKSFEFGAPPGWDTGDWYTDNWDIFDETFDDETFETDGSTVTFDLVKPLAKDVKYNVYINGQRVDDDTWDGTSTVEGNTYAFMAPIVGDGLTNTFTFENEIRYRQVVEELDSSGLNNPPSNVITLRRATSDGSRVVDESAYDTAITGGDLAYSTATGIKAEDINVDGDGFVTATTSKGPEETVPGQLFDTLDIKVYTSPESGVPFISEMSHRGNGSTTTYSIGDYPGTLGSVTVTVDGVVKKGSALDSTVSDYTINVANKTITFDTAPANHTQISTKVFAISGENYRVLNSFTGDGSTTTFLTSTRGEFNLDSTSSDIYVTVDGVPITAYSTTTSANTITVVFDSAPEASSYVQIAGFNKSSTSTRSYASVRNQSITYDGSTNRYTLTYPPGAIGPFSGLTTVEVNGRVATWTRQHLLLRRWKHLRIWCRSGLEDDSTVDPAKTISSASQVQVFVNGVKKDLSTHYTVDVGNQNVEFVTAHVPTTTDVICISTLVDHQYFNEGTDIILVPSAITSPYSLSASDVLSVTTFNNALGMKQRREVLEGRGTGVFKLRFNTLDAGYTYVWLNGQQLIQASDYTVSGNTITVNGRTISSSDRLDVMYFAVDSAVNATGFRIFKDMLNRTFYKRISKTATTKLTLDMTESTQTFTVEDASVLPTPDIASNTPGVVFIDKERIEYFSKSDNVLSQLRRGTLGTGIKEHGSGTEVVDASGTQTIPYADTVYTNTFTGDGSTLTFALSQAPSSASELDIFIGGQRLLLTSEDGSTINYSVDGSTTAVTVSSAPASGTQVKILHKKGQVWYTALDGNPADGKGLQASGTQQAKFIANEPTNAPE